MKGSRACNNTLRAAPLAFAEVKENLKKIFQSSQPFTSLNLPRLIFHI